MILVWDLETVPDANDASKPDEGDKRLPKLIYHSVVCIGALLAERTADGWAMVGLQSEHAGENDEAHLIRSFVELVGEWSPQMVTFNGHSFDLPVLRYRAMVHQISAPALTRRPYFHRFTDDHQDLCDLLASFSFSGRAKLDEMAKVMGLPGKPDGMDGSQVEGYFRAGRIEEIAHYCENDVVTTYRLWLRHELFRGAITKSEFDWSEINCPSR